MPNALNGSKGLVLSDGQIHSISLSDSDIEPPLTACPDGSDLGNASVELALVDGVIIFSLANFSNEELKFF
jgi:hypothetical protein